MNRLETISSDLAIQLQSATEAKQRAAALAACEFALAHAKIASPVIDEAVQRLSRNLLTAENIAQIESLAARLDQEYFDLQEAAEEGHAAPAAYLERFSEARAVAALVFACKEDAPEAAADAIYEAA